MAFGTILAGALPGVLNSLPDLAGVFSNDYREDQIALAQAQAQGYASVLEMQRAQTEQTKPNYTLYAVVGLCVLVAFYFFVIKK